MTNTSARQPLLIASILTVMFLAAMDAMITSTIMPTMIAAIGGLNLYPWVAAIFMLASLITTPVYGKLSDLYGHKRFILLAIAIFLIGSLLCGMAQTMPQLILFRAIQGIGGGGLVTMTFILFGVLFPPEARGRMQGLLSSMWAIASIAGPIVGALFVQTLGWRWAFTINLPIGIVSALLIARYLHVPDHQPSLKPIDTWGALLFALSSLFWMSALMELNQQHLQPQNWAMLLVGLALTLALIRHERRVDEPLLPVPLFRNPIFAVSIGLNSLVAAGFFSSMNFIPLFVQGVGGGSAGQAGQVLTVISLGWVTSSAIAGRLVNRHGLRLFSVLGCLSMAASFALLASIHPEGLWAYLIVAPMGLGMGAVVTTTLLAVQSAAPPQMIGAATSGLQLFRSIGGALGMSILGGIQLGHFKAALAESNSPWVSEAHLILDPIGRQTLSGEALQALTGFLGGSIQHVFVLAGLLGAIGFVLAWKMPSKTPAQIAAITPSA